MSREAHVRFCERLAVKSRWPTLPPDELATKIDVATKALAGASPNTLVMQGEWVLEHDFPRRNPRAETAGKAFVELVRRNVAVEGQLTSRNMPSFFVRTQFATKTPPTLLPLAMVSVPVPAARRSCSSRPPRSRSGTCRRGSSGSRPPAARPASVFVVVEAAEATVGRRVAEHPVVVRVLAGVEGRARRAAERPVGEVVGEGRALSRELRLDGRHLGQRGRVWSSVITTTTLGRCSSPPARARSLPPAIPAAIAATAGARAPTRRRAPIAPPNPEWPPKSRATTNNSVLPA